MSGAGGDRRERVDLAIGGMTCAACAARVEKRLNRMPGVTASVNYATERASVDYAGDRVAVADLIATVRATGYSATAPQESPDGSGDGDHSDHNHGAVSGRRVIAAAALSLPVMLVSMVPALQFDRWQWWALLLTTPVVLWGAWPFHRAAWTNLRHGAATMDTLISLGTLAAWGWSLAAMLFLGAGAADMRMAFSLVTDPAAASEHIYLEVAAGVTVFLLAGRWLEQRAKRRAGSALRSLLELGAKEVTLLDADGRERRAPVSELAVGMRFVVRPGERIATDGVIETGHSAVDNALLTGESVPVEVAPGAAVIGASVNVAGRLVVRATGVGADTALARISRIVGEAQAGKASVQRLADRVSAVFVPAVILLAAATLGFWLANGAGATYALTATVAVLIIACPCALGLATPTALLAGTGRGAQLGLLITGPEVLESTRRIDTVVLDKTGTVTTGQMTMVRVVSVAPVTRADALEWAAAVELGSEHPVGAAIVRGAAGEGIEPPPAADLQAYPGGGITGTVAGVAVAVGRPALLSERGIAIPEQLRAALAVARADGLTAVLVAREALAVALIAVADRPKETSALAVARLRALGLQPLLLTGDHATTAAAVAAEVGIDEVIAEVLPADKAAVIAARQRAGAVIAMVGDGVNDAPALAQADLGIAVGTGTDVAIEAADLTVVSGDLTAVADAVRLARRTLATIRGNLFWAFAYNVAALPLAAAGFLNPLVAGAAMACSSLFVVGNSLRLRRFRPLAAPVATGEGLPSRYAHPTDAPRWHR